MQRRNKVALNRYWLIIFGLVSVAMIFVIVRMFYFPITTDKSVYHFRINTGESFSQVAQRLEREGIVVNKTLFLIFAKLRGEENDIKAGDHKLTRDMSLDKILDEFVVTPKDDSVWVTIPEGLRYDEVATIFDNAFTNVEGRKFSTEEFMKYGSDPWLNLGNFEQINAEFSLDLPRGQSIEGFLFPDTYNLKADTSAETVFKLLLSTFKQKYSQLEVNKVLGKERSTYEIVTMASMLEREAFNSEEADYIADILWRRLDQGMSLGVDATLLYEQKDWKANLTYAILGKPSRYNTRLNLGLPPTPIANPGLETLTSAVNPFPNEYYYYLHDNDGEVHYAKTLAEHNRNVSQYLN